MLNNETQAYPITNQPVSSQHQRWAEQIDLILQFHPEIAAGLPSFNRLATHQEHPPPYSAVVFDEIEFQKNMAMALRSEKWDSTQVNNMDLFSNLTKEEKLLLWDTLKDPDVNFNPFVMDLALKLVEIEENVNARDFNDLLKFVIQHLKKYHEVPLEGSQTAPPAFIPLTNQNQAELGANYPNPTTRDSCDICIWCCFWNSMFNSHSHPVPMGGGVPVDGSDDCCACDCCICDGDGCDCDGGCF